MRALAAIYVVLHHAAAAHLSGPAALPFRFGQEAVIVFFVLSGFVIFANENNRVLQEPGRYLTRRIRRIYPPMLASIILAATLSAVDPQYVGTFEISELLGTVLSVQDISDLKPGVVSDPVLNNDALWSLSYEMAFYLTFPIVMILWRRSQRLANTVIGLAAVFGYATYELWPNHISLMATYFLIWWLGAVLADRYLQSDLSLSAILEPLLWLAALTALAALVAYVRGNDGFGMYPILMLRHFSFAAICILASLTPLAGLVCTLASAANTPVAFAASISFGLYVFHYPLIVNWSLAATPIGMTFAISLLVMLAILGDRVLDRIIPRPKSKVAKPSLALQ